MNWLHTILAQAPDIALFLSLALGYWIGQFKFGKFQLGGVAGSLLVAVVISQVGVSIDNGIKSLLFALFIYAVGFESGPQFFRSLGKQSLREIAMARVLALSGLLCVVVFAKIFSLDKGISAGIAAGALTQSAIIGTASAAIGKLALGADEIKHLQGNVAVGYAVTYIFGSFGAILMCVNVVPWLMKRSIRDDAIKADAQNMTGIRVHGIDEQDAAPDLVGRIYNVQQGTGQTIQALEAQGSAITMTRVKRDNAMIGVTPDLILNKNDVVLVIGRRQSVLNIASAIGTEVESSKGMDVLVVTRHVVIKAPQFIGQTLAQIRDSALAEIRHGIYVTDIQRGGQAVQVVPETRIEAGDIVTLYGMAEDVQRAAALAGATLIPSDKTDFIFHGLGLVCGLLAGMLVLRIGSIPLTLGSGGGALLAGLAFGWYRSRKMTFGNMPTGASTLLRDLGLAGFVAVVGLQSGRQAISTIAEQGISIFLIGVAVTLLPLLITLLFGRYVLRYSNTAILAGALAGSRSANPAFGEILDKAGNSVATIPFAVTYALANVFLTLLGPLIVALT